MTMFLFHLFVLYNFLCCRFLYSCFFVLFCFVLFCFCLDLLICACPCTCACAVCLSVRVYVYCLLYFLRHNLPLAHEELRAVVKDLVRLCVGIADEVCTRSSHVARALHDSVTAIHSSTTSRGIKPVLVGTRVLGTVSETIKDVSTFCPSSLGPHAPGPLLGVGACACGGWPLRHSDVRAFVLHLDRRCQKSLAMIGEAAPAFLLSA